MKDSFKKKLVRNRQKGPDMWNKLEMKIGQKSRCPETENGGQNEARKTKNAMGGLR